MAAMISFLLRKYRYTAPVDSPASAMTSCIDVLWNPLCRNRRRAASRICSRRAARWASETRGTPRM